MDSLKSVYNGLLSNPKVYFTTCSVVIISFSYFVFRRYGRKPVKTYPYHMVVVHKYGAGHNITCLSPFTTKLETYLRLTKIPYETCHSFEKSNKGKIPWISHKSKNIADSQFCIEYLNEIFGIDLNKNLSDVEKALSSSFRFMVEESLYYTVLSIRWRYNFDKNKSTFLDWGIPFFILPFLKRPMKKYLHTIGIGRHTQEEVYHIGKTQLKALSDFLGEKSFFFGDEPVEVDCAIFGQLAWLYYCETMDSELSSFAKENCHNLLEFCERMKDLLWPDWNDLLKE